MKMILAWLLSSTIMLPFFTVQMLQRLKFWFLLNVALFCFLPKGINIIVACFALALMMLYGFTYILAQVFYQLDKAFEYGWAAFTHPDIVDEFCKLTGPLCFQRGWLGYLQYALFYPLVFPHSLRSYYKRNGRPIYTWTWAELNEMRASNQKMAKLYKEFSSDS